MKAFIFGLVLASGLMGHAAQLVVIEGHIKKVTTAEFDPVVIGDACLIEIETEEKEIYAVLTDFDACHEATSELFEGRALVVATSIQDEIKSSQAFKILRECSKAKRFFAADFGAVENGMAD